MKLQPSRRVEHPRRLITTQRRSAARLVRDNRELIDLASNDYLGLAHAPELIAAATQAAHDFGVGAAASSAITGFSPVHQQLADAIAHLKRTESALLFPTGYAANLAAVTVSAKPDTVIFCDRLAHASLLDGCRLSGAATRFYRHRDLKQLARLLERYQDKHSVIITEGLFSMDGTFGPIDAIVDLARANSSTIIVDEAHSNGICGDAGEGLFTGPAKPSEIEVLHVGTLSKAFGSQGGFIAATNELTQSALDLGRTGLFSTALAPPLAAAALAAIELSQAEPHRRERLRSLSDQMHHALLSQSWRVTSEHGSPIIPIIVGSAENASWLSESLTREGFFVPAIRPPTVKASECRLRISLQADLPEPEFERFIQVLEKLKGQSR